jgi:flagellin
MSVINTNVSSLIAQNAITSNSRAQSNAMQQLSTGLRINGAKDDAAGLSIASKMTSQIKGLDQAVRNSNDAISMLQTADGALVAVGDMMQRMRELSVQGASDTNVASDRTALQAEFSQLSNEVSRIAKSTQWNGMNILDGSANGGTGTFNFQVGSSAGQTVPKTIVNMGAVASTTGTAAIVTTAATSTAGQIDTMTIAGTYAAGDVITVNGRNSQQFQYTVVAGSTSPTAIATGIIAGLTTGVNGNPSFQVANGIAVAGTAPAVTFTGPINTTIAAPTASIASGTLANVKDMNISTQANAAAAIGALDTSIAAVNSQRSDLGATINRLTYAADNLANVSQNAQASRSRVQDTDYAKTSTELARTQIIAQAATAMLAQANQSQQSVLALLK